MPNGFTFSFRELNIRCEVTMILMVNALNEYNALGTFMYLRRYEVHIYLGLIS